jgi:hypothetical protein
LIPPSIAHVPFYPLKLGLVWLPDYHIHARGEHDEPCDELQLISGIIGVHSSTIRAVVPRINRLNAGCWRIVELVSDNGLWKLVAQHAQQKRPFSFVDMSDGLRHMLLIEMCAAIATFYAEFAPTILMLDGRMGVLDPNNFALYAAYLLAPRMHFQSVMMLANPPKAQWAGWEFVRLVGAKKDVHIDQSPF